MTREECIEFANALKNNYTIDFDKLPEFCDLVISALNKNESAEEWYKLLCEKWDSAIKGDLISKEQANAKLKAICERMNFEYNDKYGEGTSGYAFVHAFDDIPSADVKENVHGHWIEQIDHEENCRTLICSNCDRPALHDEDSIWKHKFCPHCGADMREPKGEKGTE